MKRNKNFKNIGNVAVNEINLCDSEIGLHMPIKKMSSNIQKEYENDVNKLVKNVDQSTESDGEL